MGVPIVGCVVSMQPDIKTINKKNKRFKKTVYKEFIRLCGNLERQALMTVALIGLLLFGTVIISGCITSSSREDNILTTKITETKVGIGSVQTNTKECPFWDRNC